MAWVLTDLITITVWNYRTRRYQLIKFSQHKITSKNISKPSTHIESIENNESIKRTKCFLTSFHELSAPNCSFGTKNMVCFIEKRMDGSFLINLRNDKKWISFWLWKIWVLNRYLNHIHKQRYYMFVDLFRSNHDIYKWRPYEA